MTKEAEGIYEFGECRLDVTERLLWCEGELKELTARRFDLLLMLVRARGRVLDKFELMSAAWPNLSQVDENNLNNSISELRKTLNDSGKPHKYIETLPKRGLSFVADVREIGVQTSVAVLPFVNMDQKGTDDVSLGRGMDDAIITRLNKIKTIIVRPQSATARFTDAERNPLAIGHQLIVDYILDARIRRVGTRLRVHAEIVSVRQGETLWKELFDENEANIFELEDAISEQVIRILRLKPTDEEREKLTRSHTDSPAAYQKYKLGRDLRNLFTEQGLIGAIEYFNQALEIDSGFAKACNGVADCYMWLGVYNLRAPKESYEVAKEWSNKALAMDQTLAGAHTVQAYISFLYDWDFASALTEFKEAIALNSNYAMAHLGYALLLAAMSRFDEALEAIRLALLIDPQSGIINVVKGILLYTAGRYQESLKQFLKTAELTPNYEPTDYGLALVYQQLGLLDEAIESAQKGIALSHRNPLNLAMMAHAYAKAGLSDKAQQVLAELNERRRERQYVSPLHMALIHAALDQQAEALELLKEACETRDQWLVLWRVDPRLNSLRENAEFESLLKDCGLVTHLS